MTGWGRGVVAVGSGLLLVAMAGTWLLVDLERAGWVASVVGGAVGVVGLAYTLLAGASGTEASDTGNATARNGGSANTGVRARRGRPRPGRARNTGDARAEGPGSDANTGWSDR
ncbi:hypothetical protein FH609_015010 [Streptomyces sp. 3MP-14]|uniref:Uncharacterized protein n=1 Tax=Streptomyces mimosae TaxID=2586635 RepID=A0A5N6ADZ6_9ACTN|nr:MULTISPECIES: hypothetical protein [Streptomyces]KAB8165728.1 hypothetical protein FH607_012335 [Streptomyces mimosae]KAB8176117.1 hypothetical protein FH609_015010 [Streptomyces sp. 3MP-14]